ncbi:slender lobes, putative [Anopheles sinensis]|uniref:Slender lobes, putative n=1 Tax=Anopheles sinensis TaxID=74873 RepID=A0A084WSW0_ANOSI|nr:slender lobes, putative [Anopheles sinensis]
MSFKSGLLCVILYNLISLGWAAEVEATADMPTVMDAIIHTMIDFRKEILDNLQLSLEYHTEQLEEIKFYLENKMEEQEKRLKKEMQEAIDQQQNNGSISLQIQELKTQTIADLKELRESNKKVQEVINRKLDQQENSLFNQIQRVHSQSIAHAYQIQDLKYSSDSCYEKTKI